MNNDRFRHVGRACEEDTIPSSSGRQLEHLILAQMTRRLLRIKTSKCGWGKDQLPATLFLSDTGINPGGRLSDCSNSRFSLGWWSPEPDYESTLEKPKTSRKATIERR